MTFVYTPPEPVAWRLEFFNGKLDMFTEYVGDAAEYGENAVPLVSLAKLRSEVERVRRETVEACAKVCDSFFEDSPRETIHPLHLREIETAESIADEVRSLK